MVMSMSGTSDFYFKNRWKGLEKISQFIGDKQCYKNNSVALSNAEEIAEITNVMEVFLSFSNHIAAALMDEKLSKKDLEIEIEALNARIKWAVEKLQEGSSLIDGELRSMVTSYANVKACDLLEKIENERKN
jgi:hypothetical protein